MSAAAILSLINYGFVLIFGIIGDGYDDYDAYDDRSDDDGYGYDDGGLARDPGNWDDLIDGPLWPEDEPPKRRTTGRTGGRRESR